jgi:hypothetical protein
MAIKLVVGNADSITSAQIEKGTKREIGVGVRRIPKEPGSARGGIVRHTMKSEWLTGRWEKLFSAASCNLSMSACVFAVEFRPNTTITIHTIGP